MSSVINTLTLARCATLPQYAAIRYTKCKCNNYVHLQFVLVRYATLQFAANVKGARVKDNKIPLRDFILRPFLWPRQPTGEWVSITRWSRRF